MNGRRLACGTQCAGGLSSDRLWALDCSVCLASSHIASRTKKRVYFPSNSSHITTARHVTAVPLFLFCRVSRKATFYRDRLFFPSHVFLKVCATLFDVAAFDLPKAERVSGPQTFLTTPR